MLTGGSIDNSGTIVIKGNLDNQTGSQTNLGTGTFQFTGTSQQTITGQNIMNNVQINNAAGVVIGGNTEIDGILTLTSGRVTIGTNNLLLGPIASVAGTPSSTAMIVATGTGLVQKQFTAPASFTFPVGDAGPHYSPVLLTLNSGTFGSGANVGLNLAATFYPGYNTSPYLSRYWNLTQNALTAFNANAQFTYLATDVTGTEANIQTIRVTSPIETFSNANAGSHYLTANGMTSFGTFTGGLGVLQTGLTAYLEGPYNAGSGLMNTTLSSGGLIPLTQPYNTSPWNYSGTESIGSIPANAVDWVLIELRQASAPATALSGTAFGRKAALLYADGSIHDIDGTSTLKFTGLSPITTNLYPVIFHRNHLAIISNIAVTKTNGTYIYDYSSAASQIYDGSGNGCILLGSKWGMIGGNGVNDAFINNNDLFNWQNSFSATNYNSADFDLSGVVNNNDLFLWQRDFSAQSKVPN